MSINTNLAIQTAQMGLAKAQEENVKLVANLSSGVVAPKIADIYVAQKMDVQVRESQVGIENAQMGMSVANIASSSLKSVNDSLSRINELSMRAANGTTSADERKAIQTEIDQQAAQINQTIANSTFNDTKTLNIVSPISPNPVPEMNFQVGGDENSTISYDPNIVMEELSFDVSTPENAVASMEKASSMIDTSSRKQTEIVATAGSLEGSIDQNRTTINNATATLSTLVDTDYVSTVIELVKNKFTQEALLQVIKSTSESQSFLLKMLK